MAIAAAILIILGTALMGAFRPQPSAILIPPKPPDQPARVTYQAGQSLRHELLHAIGAAFLGVGVLALAVEVVDKGFLRRYRESQDAERIESVSKRVLNAVLDDASFVGKVGEAAALANIEDRLLRVLKEESASSRFLIKKLKDQLSEPEIRNTLRIDFILETDNGSSLVDQTYYTNRPYAISRFVLRVFSDQQQQVAQPPAATEWTWNWVLPIGDSVQRALEHFSVESFSVDEDEWHVGDMTLTDHNWPQGYKELSIPVTPRARLVESDQFTVSFKVRVPPPNSDNEYVYFAAGRFTRNVVIRCDTRNNQGFDVAVVDYLGSQKSVRTFKDRNERWKGVRTDGWVGPEAAVAFAIATRASPSDPTMQSDKSRRSRKDR